MVNNRQVWVTPPGVTFDNKAHVSWTSDGNHNRGQFGAKLTARTGMRRFKTYRDAVTFGKQQALRMGEGTELGLHGVMAQAKFYTVKNDKFVLQKRPWH